MAETALTIGERTFELRRPHTTRRSPFRAWSAADLLAIEELVGLTEASTVLIINEQWGAVGVAARAAGLDPYMWSDSVAARSAVEANFAANDLSLSTDRLGWGTDAIRPSSADAVVLLPTKHSDLTAWQSQLAAAACKPGARAYAAVMSKHQSKAMIEAMQTGFARVEPRRAVGKARVIDLHEPRGLAVPEIAAEPAFTTTESVPVHSLPGVFAGDRLDPATALLLEHLRSEPLRELVADAGTVVDLGCGNGVIAATLARRHGGPHFVLLDASERAQIAADATWQASGLPEGRRSLLLADGPSRIAERSVDLVVSNPPFHQGHAVDAELAHRLVAEAARALRPEGALVAVAHRSVELHHGLSRAFDEVKAISGDPNFVVVRANQPKSVNA